VMGGGRPRGRGWSRLGPTERLADELPNQLELLGRRRDLEGAAKRVVEVGADARRRAECADENAKKEAQLHRR